MTMKLGLRLLILVLIAALPVLAFQVYGLVQDREQRKAAIAEQALNLARLAAAQQDQFIEGARYLLAAAAQLPEVQNRNARECDQRMAELLVQFPTITGIGAVAPDGVQFCSGLRESTGISLADRPYFQQAVRNKSLAISGYIIGRETGRPHLNFAYPALDAAGEIRAVVVLAFSLGRLSANLSATPLPANATMSLVDGYGVLLGRDRRRFQAAGNAEPRSGHDAAAKRSQTKQPGNAGLPHAHTVAGRRPAGAGYRSVER
jgi:hypothetical protein